MGRSSPPAVDAIKIPLSYHFGDDLDGYVTGGRWTALASDSGASAAAEDYSATYGFNGCVLLTTGGTDNNEATIYTTKKNFLLADTKSGEAMCRFHFAEASTNAANVFIGFTSAPGANLMVDDGAGPATSMSGFGFYKIDSSSNTNWNTITSIGSTQTLTQLNATGSATKSAISAIGGAITTAKFNWNVVNSTQVEIEFFMDQSGGQNFTLLRKETFTYTSAAAMGFSIYAKTGASASQLLRADYVYVNVKR